MLQAEFDQFAQEYQQQHAASIRLSGETPDFFAQYKIDDVAARLARSGAKPRRILDFGAGVGNSLGPMRAAFPDSEITLLDPSSQSLDIAASAFPARPISGTSMAKRSLMKTAASISPSLLACSITSPKTSMSA